MKSQTVILSSVDICEPHQAERNLTASENLARMRRAKLLILARVNPILSAACQGCVPQSILDYQEAQLSEAKRWVEETLTGEGSVLARSSNLILLPFIVAQEKNADMLILSSTDTANTRDHFLAAVWLRRLMQNGCRVVTSDAEGNLTPYENHWFGLLSEFMQWVLPKRQRQGGHPPIQEKMEPVPEVVRCRSNWQGAHKLHEEIA